MGRLANDRQRLAELTAKKRELEEVRQKRAEEMAEVRVALSEDEYAPDARVRRKELSEVLALLDARIASAQEDVNRARLDVKQTLRQRRRQWENLEAQEREWRPVCDIAPEAAEAAAAVRKFVGVARGLLPQSVIRAADALVAFCAQAQTRQSEIELARERLLQDGDECASETLPLDWADYTRSL